MNIGNRKKKPESEFIPEFKKRCNLPNITCGNCFLFSHDIQWCSMYEEELHEHLMQGKRFKD